MHSELSDLPLDFEHAGRTYKVRLIDDDTDTLFERTEYKRAMDSLLESRDMYSELELQEEKQKLRDRRDSGYFSLQAMRANPSLQRSVGLKVLAIAMGISIHEVKTIAISAPEKITDLLFDLYSLSYPPLREGLQSKKKVVREKVLQEMSKLRAQLLDSSENFGGESSPPRPTSPPSADSISVPSVA